jgi:RNA polymerase sigma-70 factor (ECF subfamily)
VTKEADLQVVALSGEESSSRRAGERTALDNGERTVATATNDGESRRRVHAVLTKLMDEYGDKIYSLCVRMVNDRELAKDVLQQVFLEASRDLQQYEGRAALSTWMYGIAVHRCKDANKASRRRLQRIEADNDVVEMVADLEASPAVTLDRRKQLADLETCIAELASKFRLAVLLRYQHSMSYEEMASMLGEKADTLQTRVRRAMLPLQRCLERKGWTGV